MSGIGDYFSNIFGDFTGGTTSLFNFMAHPMESIMFLVGGILLLVLVFKLLDN